MDGEFFGIEPLSVVDRLRQTFYRLTHSRSAGNLDRRLPGAIRVLLLVDVNNNDPLALLRHSVISCVHHLLAQLEASGREHSLEGLIAVNMLSTQQTWDVLEYEERDGVPGI